MSMHKNDIRMLLKMFAIFFRIGAFTIGGGYAMLPLIEKEVVDKQKWLSEKEIVDVFAIVQSVPGVIAINSSIFIGYKMKRMSGAVAAALGVILPSFMIILGIAFLLFNIQDNIYVQKAFTGVGVVGLIGLAAVRLGKVAIEDKLGIALAILAFVSIIILDVHAIFVIILGSVIGLYAYRKRGVK